MISRLAPFALAVLIGALSGTVVMSVLQIREVAKRDAHLARLVTQSRQDAEHWWLVVTATSPPLPESLVAEGWPKELLYLHTLRDFPDQAACEAWRPREVKRAEDIVRSVGPHYVTFVSQCRQAMFVRGRCARAFARRLKRWANRTCPRMGTMS